MISSRHSQFVRSSAATLEVYVSGTGPALVALPSYGRDGGADFDYFADRVSAAGFKVIRPQPRGIAGSQGNMAGVSLPDLAADVGSVIRELGEGHAFVLGHAFGNGVARMLAVQSPLLVRGIILASAQCSTVPAEIGATPHVACDLAAPTETRLAALRKGFFASNHDPSAWLDGWYPETMRMEVGAAGSVEAAKYWAGGAAPILEIIPDADPFKPPAYWHELPNQLGDRVTTELVANASHALFPEEPDQVVQIVVAWCQRLLTREQRYSLSGVSRSGTLL